MVPDSVFYIEPLKEPSFKNKSQIVNSYRSLLDSYDKCINKIRYIKREVRSYEKLNMEK